MGFFDDLDRFANEVEKAFRGKPEALMLKSCKKCSFYKRGYCTQTSPPTRILSEYYAQGCIYYTTSLPVVGVNNINTWQDAENLDATHGYTSYIWIPDETLQIKLLKLHVYAEKFRAFSKSALGGGACEPTSSEGGACVPTTTENTKFYSGKLPTAIDTKYTIYDYHATSGPSSIDYADIPIMGDCPDGHGVCAQVDDETIGYADIYHTHDPNIDMEQFYAITNYSDVVLAQGAHDHDVNIPNHTHTVTIPNHTHPIEYGIYEEAIAGRTLSAKLYDPDDVLLKDFGVIVTGEDDLILDLSDYFETLQYGMFRLELTASSRLRARLIYYELCVMSAVS